MAITANNHELTPRQWRLYNLLKDIEGWRTQYEIACMLPDEYPCTADEFEDYHNSASRSNITADIRAINKSDVIQKMIISSKRGVKLATEDEARKYLRARYGSIFRQLERARNLERKAGLDGQFKFVFANEREIVQAFTDSNEVGRRWKAARRAAGIPKHRAVMLMRKYCRIDEPTLTKIERGALLPTLEQRAAFDKIYR